LTGKLSSEPNRTDIDLFPAAAMRRLTVNCDAAQTVQVLTDAAEWTFEAPGQAAS
jgi:hypothetical protein